MNTFDRLERRWWGRALIVLLVLPYVMTFVVRLVLFPLIFGILYIVDDTLGFDDFEDFIFWPL